MTRTLETCNPSNDECGDFCCLCPDNLGCHCLPCPRMAEKPEDMQMTMSKQIKGQLGFQALGDASVTSGGMKCCVCHEGNCYCHPCPKDFRWMSLNDGIKYFVMPPIHLFPESQMSKGEWGDRTPLKACYICKSGQCYKYTCPECPIMSKELNVRQMAIARAADFSQSPEPTPDYKTFMTTTLKPITTLPFALKHENAIVPDDQPPNEECRPAQILKCFMLEPLKCCKCKSRSKKYFCATYECYPCPDG